MKIRGRDLFARWSGVLGVVDRISAVLPARLFRTVFVLCRFTPGLVGVGIRYICVRRLFAECGTNVRIKVGCIVDNMQNIRCGDNVSIGDYCHIDAQGPITFGNDISVGQFASILAFEHTNDDLSIPFKYNPIEVRPITIETDSNIATGARVLGGTHLVRRTVVGANAVCTGGTYGPGFVFGIPGRTRQLP